jgi:peptidoglycan/LPS O-acetylase OafA/YrhL
LAGATVFCLCTKQDPSPRLWRVVSPLDHASYTVYLYHILLIDVLQYDILPYVTASVGLRFALSAVTVYGGIAVFAWVRNRIKRKKA